MSGLWHFRPVAAAVCLWAVIGAGDYTLAQLRAPAYLALFSKDQILYFTGMPFWVNALWALAVWSGVLGAILLVFRAGGAALSLGLSAAAMTAFTLWLVLLSSPPMQAVTGVIGVAVMLGATLVAAAFWLYARALHAAGHLP